MQKITFENLPSTNTPLNASNLNILQDNVEDAFNNTYGTSQTEAYSQECINNNVGVVDSGSNNNGSYIKYADGTMICTNRVSQVKNIDGQFEGSYFTSIDRVNFPQEFISEPYITATLEQNGSLLGFNLTSRDTTSFGAYVWKQQAKNNVTFYINYIAIGRWK
jgi:hypothetical protein